MASSIPENDEPPQNLKAVVVSYSNRIWNSLRGIVPSLDSSLLSRISSTIVARRRRTTRSRSRGTGLPLPLPRRSSDAQIAAEDSGALVILEDIMEHILSNLHTIQKNLLFWQSRAEGTRSQILYFVLFERGPRAFAHGTFQMIRELHSKGSPLLHLYRSAAVMISERIAVLTKLQKDLATVVAELYLVVNKFGDILTEDADKSLPSLLVTINDIFSRIEASFSQHYEVQKSFSSSHGGNQSALLFQKLPEIVGKGLDWSDIEIRDAVNLISENLFRFDAYISLILSSCRKPGKLSLYWLHYSYGAVGLSLCSFWLLRHSRLMGSSNIDNWVNEAKESINGFWKEHVEQPIISIRDELFETFKRRHKGVMEVEEVQLTASSLRRMLLAFCDQTNGKKLSENASDQEMLEIVMARYEKELTHPLQNLLSGELARAMLIQIQKLKLDIETAMLELDQILKANEINFAVLAALPAFFLSLLLLALVRAWILQDKGAEGRGRIARRQRRLLLVEVEKKIVQFQIFTDQGLEEDARGAYGLVLYSLDRLYKAVEKHAKKTGEWRSLLDDMVDLAKPNMKTEHKQTVVLRMGRMYECLLPSLKKY